MKPEYPNDGQSTLPNKIGNSCEEEHSIKESKNKDEELDDFSSEIVNKINKFFEIHNSFLYEDDFENLTSLENYLSVDQTSEVNMTGSCSNGMEIVEDEKHCTTNSQKLYSSLKRYCLRNPKEKTNIAAENGKINAQSAEKSLINPHIDIEAKIAIPDSFQLPISNETSNTVTFDTSISENNMIDIKFPICSASDLSLDLTEAQKSIRLNKKSTLKKNIKKFIYEKKLPYKSDENFSLEETPGNVSLELENSKLSLKENNKQLINDKIEPYETGDECCNSDGEAFRAVTEKFKLKNEKKTLKKKHKKSINVETGEYSDYYGTAFREMGEKPKLEDSKPTLKRNNKKPINNKIEPYETDEFSSSDEEASRVMTEKLKFENKKPTSKKKHKESIDDEMKLHETAKYSNYYGIAFREVSEKLKLENRKSTSKKNNKKTINDKIEPDKTDELGNSDEEASKEETEKLKLENEKSAFKKNSKKSMNNITIEPCETEKVYYPSDKNISRKVAETYELENKKKLKGNYKKLTNNKVTVPHKPEECLKSNGVAMTGLTENPDLKKKPTLKKNNRKSSNDKMTVSLQTNECFTPIKVLSSCLAEKPEFENKKLSTKGCVKTTKKLLVTGEVHECLNAEKVHVSCVNYDKHELKNKKSSSKKNKKLANEKKNVLYESEKCLNSEEIVSPDTLETSKLENKKSVSRKNSKKSTTKGMIVPYEMGKCFSPPKIIPGYMLENNEAKNDIRIFNEMQVESFLNLKLTLTSIDIRELSIVLTDCLKDNQDFRKQLKNKNDILCYEKALSKFNYKFKKENKSVVKTEIREESENISKEVLDKSNKCKHSKKIKISLPDTKNSLNKTESSEKEKYKISESQNVINQTKISKNTTDIEEKEVLKKGKLKTNDNLDKISVDLSLPKRVSRKRPTSQIYSKTNIDKKSLFNKPITPEDKDILKENDSVEMKDLSVNDTENNLTKNEKITVKNIFEQVQNSTQSVLTSTPLSHNSPVKSMVNSNSMSSSPICKEPEENTSQILYLFNDFMKKRNLDISNSNQAFAEIFEQPNKSDSSSKICKELDQKQDGEQSLQLISLKDCRTHFIDSKPSKPIEEKNTRNTISGRKRCNKDDVEIPQEKKKSLLQNSFENGFQVCNSETTKELEAKASRKSSRKTKNSEYKGSSSQECSEKSTVKINTDSTMQKRRSARKSIKNLNSVISSSVYSTNIKLNEKTSPRRKKNTVKPTGIQNEHQMNKKVDLSGEIKFSYNDESIDACDFLKVTDVKSLAEDQNLKKEDLSNLMLASFSEDPKVTKTFRKKQFDSVQKNKSQNDCFHSSELSDWENISYSDEVEKQTEENNLIELNTTGKRKRKPTSNDPNFYYETKSPQTKKRNKSVSDHKKHTELAVLKYSPTKNDSCKEISSINQINNIGMLLAENTSEPNTQIHTIKDPLLNSSGMPISSLTPDQKKTLASYTLFPLSSLCKLLWNPSQPSQAMLAVPMQVSGSSPLMLNVTANDYSTAPTVPFQIQNYPVQNFPVSQFISPPQHLNHLYVPQQNFHATPIVSGQNIQSIMATNDVPTSLTPQVIPSLSTKNVPLSVSCQGTLSTEQPQTVNHQTISVSNSEELSSILQSGENSFHCSKPSFSSGGKKDTRSKNRTEISEKVPQIQNKNNALNDLAIATQNIPLNGSKLNNTIEDITLSSARIAAQNEKCRQIQNENTALNSKEIAVLNAESHKKDAPIMMSADEIILLKWQLFLGTSLEPVDSVSIEETAKILFGKNSQDFTVREFCSLPEVIEKIPERLYCRFEEEDQGAQYQYEFRDDFLDELFIGALKDFVAFYLECIFSEIQDKSDGELATCFWKEIYKKFPLSFTYFCTALLKKETSSTELTLEKITATFGVIGMMYIFYNVAHKLFPNMITAY